jgi:hypothetical protein
MSGCSGVAYPKRRVVGGDVKEWYQSFSSTLILDGLEELSERKYSQKSNFEVTKNK